MKRFRFIPSLTWSHLPAPSCPPPSSPRGESHVFNIELVDDEGTAIEATLWREFAALQHSRLAVDRVYFVTGGQLKVADKRYATVRNPYTMHLDNRTGIEDAPEEQQAAASRMAAKLQYVPFNDLPAFINSRTTVDILGVATQVAPLGSVKRKSDQTELTRRDVTLVDASKRSVTVTLWGDLASGFGAEIESLTHPVVSIAAVRVSDYNGLSLSTVTRSSGMANMDTPEARKLREWYEGEGRSADIVAANEGLAGARGAGEKGPRPVVHLSAINDSQVYADSKPEYYSVYARFLSIREDQVRDGGQAQQPSCLSSFNCAPPFSSWDSMLKRPRTSPVPFDFLPPFSNHLSSPPPPGSPSTTWPPRRPTTARWWPTGTARTAATTTARRTSRARSAAGTSCWRAWRTPRAL